VKDVSLTWRSPFKTVIGNGLALTPNPVEETQRVTVGGMAGDDHYLSTMGIELLLGRNFTQRNVSEEKPPNEFIVNVSFLEEFGISQEEIIGKQVTLGLSQSGPGTIIGVVKDFHIASLHTKVKPVVIFNDPAWFGAILVRTEGSSMTDVLSEVEQRWKSLMPQQPFSYTFLDDEYNDLYQSEQQIGKLITWGSVLAILIACFGLLGLSSYTTVQRSREIGIRKVLGATTQNIVLLFSRGYINLLLISFLLAVPLSYYLMNKWLQNFAYPIPLSPWYFVIPIISVAVIAWLTVSYHTVKASMTSPAETLKCE
jgi:putative ABC transport system permease protein